MTDRNRSASKSRELTIRDLVPGGKVRALVRDVRDFVLDLGSNADHTFYNGTAYRVRWGRTGPPADGSHQAHPRGCAGGGITKWRLS